MDFEYPLKNVRLKQLEEAGFNVADWIYFPPNELDLVQLKEFFDKHGKLSCRTFHADEKRHFKGPFKFDVASFKEVATFCAENNKNWFTLCNEVLPEEKEGFTGNIRLEDRISYMVEYWDGCESPRNIEHKSAEELKRFHREFGIPLPEDAPRPLVEIAGRFGHFLPESRPIILEFNIYPYPVGRRQRPDVFWEWRK